MAALLAGQTMRISAHEMPTPSRVIAYWPLGSQHDRFGNPHAIQCLATILQSLEKTIVMAGTMAKSASAAAESSFKFLVGHVPPNLMQGNIV